MTSSTSLQLNRSSILSWSGLPLQIRWAHWPKEMRRVRLLSQSLECGKVTKPFPIPDMSGIEAFLNRSFNILTLLRCKKTFQQLTDGPLDSQVQNILYFAQQRYEQDPPRTFHEENTLVKWRRGNGWTLSSFMADMLGIEYHRIPIWDCLDVQGPKRIPKLKPGSTRFIIMLPITRELKTMANSSQFGVFFGMTKGIGFCWVLNIPYPLVFQQKQP